MNRLLLAYCLLAVAGSTVVCAQDLPPAAGTPDVVAPIALWSGAVSGGYIRTSGNSSTSATNLKIELDYTNQPWRNELGGTAANGHTGSSTSAEQYTIGDKLKFSFNEVDYAFGAVAFDDDRFSGISKNFSQSAGYGRRLLMTEHQILDAELGAGISEQQNVGESNYDVQPILTVGGKYIYALSRTSLFVQRLRTEIGSRNTFINPVSQLKLSIVGALFATLNYEVRYNTTVPPETRHTDIITSINFGYGFGGVKP